MKKSTILTKFIANRGIFNKEELIRLRKEKKLSCYALALETGLEESELGRMEKGQRKNISFASISALAEYFNVPIKSLLTIQ